jgi:hypothetical protein
VSGRRGQNKEREEAPLQVGLAFPFIVSTMTNIIQLIAIAASIAVSSQTSHAYSLFSKSTSSNNDELNSKVSAVDPF